MKRRAYNRYDGFCVAVLPCENDGRAAAAAAARSLCCRQLIVVNNDLAVYTELRHKASAEPMMTMRA